MKKYLLIFCLIITGALIAQSADLTIKSDKQSFSNDANKGKFEGNVEVQIDDIHVKSPYAEATINAIEGKLDEATFFDKPYAFQIKDGKKSEIKSNILKVSLLRKVITAQGNAQTIVTTEKKPTAIITADTQEYNTNTNIMTATGNAIINYDDVSTYSEKAVAYLDKNNDLKEMQLVGNAKIERGENKLRADKFMYKAQSEIAIANGNAYTDLTAENGDRIQVWSNYQQYDQKNNIVMASGNVKVHYKDYIAEGPKATIYPDKKTNKLNEVVFTGRAKITETTRSIVADKIVMYMNPKNFFAEGNVVTSIRNIKDANTKK